MAQLRSRVGIEVVSDGSFDGKDRCHAWLYLPEGATEASPAPVLVMGHGLGAVKEMRLAANTERFQAEGYACLVFSAVLRLRRADQIEFLQRHVPSRVTGTTAPGGTPVV